VRRILFLQIQYIVSSGRPRFCILPTNGVATSEETYKEYRARYVTVGELYNEELLFCYEIRILQKTSDYPIISGFGAT
jgi:hypothetical protein